MGCVIMYIMLVELRRDNFQTDTAGGVCASDTEINGESQADRQSGLLN